MACGLSHLLLPLLLLVCLGPVPHSRAAAVKGFWSVDCGSEVGFTDPHTNLSWDRDDEHAYTGERHRVTAIASLKRELTTLRAFPPPWPRKNCFSFYFSDSEQILVRAYFYYGNYDGLGKPPTFLLQFDGNPWATVVTTMDSVVTHEVIYVTQGTSSSICVSRTDPEQHPFVSAIEVRTLETTMYTLTDRYHALFAKRFAAFGANEAFRYPDDPYDRIWTPTSKQLEGYSYKLLANNATIGNVTNDANHPPSRLLQNAAVPLGGPGSNLTVSFHYLPPGTMDVYFSIYYTEVTRLTTSDKRSFDVYIDGSRANEDPIVPEFGVEGRYSVTRTTSNPVLELVPNKSNSLPPLLSGLEVFVVSEPLNNGTRQEDVDMMHPLKENFKILGNWTGDPCFPEGYNWEWIGCRVQNYSARITKLLLGGFGLSGSIPDITPLDALETIDLHGNRFIGRVPEFLGNFSELKVLNLADNDFSEIPPSILNYTNLLLNYTGNPKLCKQGMVCVLHESITGPPSGQTIINGAPSCRALLRNLLLLGVFFTISTIV